MIIFYKHLFFKSHICVLYSFKYFDISYLAIIINVYANYAESKLVFSKCVRNLSLHVRIWNVFVLES